MERILHTLQNIKDNLADVQEEWEGVQIALASTVTPDQIVKEHDAIVPKAKLDQLASETSQLKEVLPELLNKTTLSHISRNVSLQKELATVMQEKEFFSSEAMHWKTQLESAVNETQKHKQEQLELRMHIQELSSELSQQSEFCTSLGASCCTLLWRVSRQDDSIQNLISGNKSDAFLELVSNSIQSYLTAYKDDQWPAPETDEATFMMAMCGTVTNIAASALGREFLATSVYGRKVVDTFITFIREAPLGKSSAMKNLMLMSLYNISINQKGLKYLCTKEGFISMLSWQLKEEKDCATMVGALRLLQSLVLDESNLRLVHELKENLPISYLQELTTHTSKDVQDLALDLIMDLRHMNVEE